jgi:hypothetical protein
MKITLGIRHDDVGGRFARDDVNNRRRRPDAATIASAIDNAIRRVISLPPGTLD